MARKGTILSYRLCIENELIVPKYLNINILTIGSRQVNPNTNDRMTLKFEEEIERNTGK
jgi:hypothetical protein